MSGAEWLSAVNDWISAHQQLITLLLVPVLTWIVTREANRSAERRARIERLIERRQSRQLKIAEFRQEWINSVRRDIAEQISFSAAPIKDEAAVFRANTGLFSILLRMNPQEPAAYAVYESLSKLRNSSEDRLEDLALEAANVSQAFLKLEWERLKRDLEKVESEVVP